MSELMTVAAAGIALVGGLTLFMALFTPKRYTAKRPRRFIIGFGCLAVSAYLHYAAGR